MITRILSEDTSDALGASPFGVVVAATTVVLVVDVSFHVYQMKVAERRTSVKRKTQRSGACFFMRVLYQTEGRRSRLC